MSLVKVRREIVSATLFCRQIQSNPILQFFIGHDRAVDYWSLGCLIYEMLFGTTPFYERGIDQKGLFRNIVRGNWAIPKKAKTSRNAIDMMTGMLQRKPTERLGCLAGGYRDIKNHPWMQEVNFVKLVKKQIKVRGCITLGIHVVFDTATFFKAMLSYQYIHISFYFTRHRGHPRSMIHSTLVTLITLTMTMVSGKERNLSLLRNS